MKELTDYSIAELNAAIEQKKSQRPKSLPEPKFYELIQACRKYVQDVLTAPEDLERDKEIIFNAAMAAIYGEDIWNWINMRR